MQYCTPDRTRTCKTQCLKLICIPIPSLGHLLTIVYYITQKELICALYYILYSKQDSNLHISGSKPVAYSIRLLEYLGTTSDSNRLTMESQPICSTCLHYSTISVHLFIMFIVPEHVKIMNTLQEYQESNLKCLAQNQMCYHYTILQYLYCHGESNSDFQDENLIS